MAKQPPRRERAGGAASALEYFEEDLDAVSEQLTPFADGSRDPHAHIDALKESYEKLYPLDEFLAYHLRDHRDGMSDATRQAIQKMQAHTSGLNFVLLAENADNPEMLENFISRTLDAIEDIKPILRELDTPGDPP